MYEIYAIGALTATSIALLIRLRDYSYMQSKSDTLIDKLQGDYARGYTVGFVEGSRLALENCRTDQSGLLALSNVGTHTTSVMCGGCGRNVPTMDGFSPIAHDCVEPCINCDARGVIWYGDAINGGLRTCPVCKGAKYINPEPELPLTDTLVYDNVRAIQNAFGS